MTAPIHPVLPTELVSCSVCLKEIPADSAMTPQVEDFVMYFCGLECYEKFAAESQQKAAPKQPPK
jgi:hypothetical protein